MAWRFPNMRRGLIGAYVPYLVGPTGETVRDESPKKNHCTLSAGMNPASDYVINGDARLSGYALEFDGTGDYLTNSTQITSLATSGSLSVLARVFTTSATNFLAICGEWGTVGNRNFRLHQGGDGNFDFNVFAGGTEGVADGTTGSVVLNTWMQICGTYDQSNVSIYKDGNLIESPSHSSGGPIENNTEPLNIGAIQGGANGWVGKINYIFFYDRALRPSEVLLDHIYPGSPFRLRSRRAYRAPDAIARRPMSPIFLNNVIGAHPLLSGLGYGLYKFLQRRERLMRGKDK